MRSIKTILTTVLLGVFLTLGCDSVVDQNSPDTSEFQVQSTENYFSVGSFGLLEPFTQDELDDNWVADRKYPTGGVESVSFDGRDNVARIGVIAEDRDANSFAFFEGIKKVADFGTHVQVDLYVPSEWQDADVVNVGFWASDDPITAYPIIVYRNSAAINAGFYTWDGISGYEESVIPVLYDNWNTLEISLDTENEVANYRINGEAAGGISAISSTIGQVFLNHYNDGARSYDAFWHAGVSNPTTKKECMSGGWVDFGFKNQGQCIRFVNTGKDSR